MSVYYNNPIRVFFRIIQKNKSRFFLFLCYLFFDQPSKNSFDPNKVSSILLLLWDNKLGDTIFSGVFISLISRFRSDIQLSVVTGPLGKSWLEKISNINIIVLSKKSVSNALSLNKNQKHFDAVIYLTSKMNYKDFIALRQFKQATILGYHNQGYRLFSYNIPKNITHFYDSFLHLARLFISKERFEKPIIPLPNAIEEPSINIQKNKWKSSLFDICAVHFIGASSCRQFHLNDAATLLKKWLRTVDKIAFFVITIPGWEQYFSQLRDIFKYEDRVCVWEGPPSFELTLKVLQSSDFCFTPDTSVIHILSALNKPVLGVYFDDQKNFSQWSPLSDIQEIVYVKKSKNKSVKTSLNNIDFDEVINAQSRLISALRS